MIDKNKTNSQLYEEVAKFLDKKVDEIRLWETDENNIKKDLKENSMNSEIKSMQNNKVQFVQNKDVTENVIPYIENGRFDKINYIMVFVKYFDSRMKTMIRYIGPMTVEEDDKLDSLQIYGLLVFPETMKFHFFIDFMPFAVRYISTQCTFRNATIISKIVLSRIQFHSDFHMTTTI